MKRGKRKGNVKKPLGPIPLDVLGTGPIQVPGISPSEGETTAIPTLGKDAHLGAIAYLAVLAYPGRTEKEWQKRNAFVEAVKALILATVKKKGYPRREILPKYRRRFKKEGTIRLAFRRINDRRMHAAVMADAMVLDGVRIGPFRIVTDMPSLNRASIAVVNVSGKEPNPLRMEMEKISVLAKEHPAVAVRQRVWRESLPVLHLSMALWGRWERMLIEDRNEMDLVYYPSWLPLTVFSAEALRAGILPKKFPASVANAPTFDPTSAVQLIPCEGWDILLSSLNL